MDNPNYQTLLKALRTFSPDELRGNVERALKELEELDRRDALKARFDALSTTQMEQVLGINREAGLGHPPESAIERIIAARKRWRVPNSAE